MNKKIISLLLVICMSAISFSGCSNNNSDTQKEETNQEEPNKEEPNQEVKQYTMGTYTATGGYMLLATGLAKIANENIKSINLTPVPSPKGSVENVQTVQDGEREFGLASSNVCLDGWLQREPFIEKTTDVMGWFSAHYGITWSVALESSGIKSFKDMEGKKVAIGAPGSNDAYLAQNIFLPMAGVDVSKVKLEFITQSEAISQMKDGHVDAYIGTGAPKQAAMADMASSRETRFVQMDEKVVNEIVAKYPEFIIKPMNIEDVPNIIMDLDTYPTVAMNHVAIVNRNIDENTVYEMTKAIFENLNSIYEIKEEFKVITLESALKGIPIEIHPGALKYFNEKGIKQ